MEKSLVFGLKCDASLASYDHQLSSWKMSQLSLFEDYQEYSLTLPRCGMMRNGALYPLETLELHTSASAGFVLPTPDAHPHKYRLKGNSQQSNCLEAKARRGELMEITGMKKPCLNPQFVAWLMGYQTDWLN